MDASNTFIMKLLRALAATAAGVWLGSMVLIAIVAQTTFQTMPTTGITRPNTVAGLVMAKNFSRFDKVQMICGAVILTWQLSHLLISKADRRDLVRLILLLGACGLMLYNAFVLTPRITHLQPLLASPESEAAVKALFADFHQTAVRISQATMLLVLVIALEMAWPMRFVAKPAPEGA